MSDSERITRLGVLARLKHVIADIKRGMTYQDIYASQNLRAVRSAGGLGFDETGFHTLTAKINKAFEDIDTELTVSQARAASTVRDLAYAIWEEVPAAHRNE